MTGFFDPMTAQCLAIREGLSFALSSGLRVQIIQTDSSNAVKEMLKEEVWSSLGLIIGDIRWLIMLSGGGTCTLHSSRGELGCPHVS
ncbi:hypothetical protein PanWU01x14_285260 [Parasponia andersonii]|uniref:RNase H type-1 domain-containing protein n=1 Tax=Parasponia andersonii TaxID=3476 RepID=A0A2P5AZM0_PARAD|nr:hypothetical protein PanWU01x14_285260 [Parasponia andersonii]